MDHRDPERGEDLAGLNAPVVVERMRERLPAHPLLAHLGPFRRFRRAKHELRLAIELFLPDSRALLEQEGGEREAEQSVGLLERLELEALGLLACAGEHEADSELFVRCPEQRPADAEPDRPLTRWRRRTRMPVAREVITRPA